jgi:hypothetical protein
VGVGQIVKFMIPIILMSQISCECANSVNQPKTISHKIVRKESYPETVELNGKFYFINGSYHEKIEKQIGVIQKLIFMLVFG